METKKEKLGAGAYVVGGLSFIPLIGVAFGIVSITWGLVTKKLGGKKLVVIGGSGILFTLVLYGALYYFAFVQEGGVYGDLRKQLAQTTIESLIQSIEYYKVQNGKYPKDLNVLSESLPKNSLTSIYDPTKAGIGIAETPLFYYENLGDSYYLLGVGDDNTPFTEDDLLPQVTPKGNVGFKIKN